MISHPLRSRRAGAASAFLAQGLVFVLLTTKLPEVQERFSLDPGDFSVYMLGLIVAAGVGSLLGEAQSRRARAAPSSSAPVLRSAPSRFRCSPTRRTGHSPPS